MTFVVPMPAAELQEWVDRWPVTPGSFGGPPCPHCGAEAEKIEIDGGAQLNHVAVRPCGHQIVPVYSIADGGGL